MIVRWNSTLLSATLLLFGRSLVEISSGGSCRFLDEVLVKLSE